MINRPTYTTVYHGVLKNLDLTWNEYGVAHTIWRLANNSGNFRDGWCYASKDSLGESLDLSKQSIHTILNKLIKKGIVIRNEQTKHLRATKRWEEAIESEIRRVEKSKESLPSVIIPFLGGYRKLPPNGQETLHNNNTNTNKNIQKDSETLLSAEAAKERIDAKCDEISAKYGRKRLGL